MQSNRHYGGPGWTVGRGFGIAKPLPGREWPIGVAGDMHTIGARVEREEVGPQAWENWLRGHRARSVDRTYLLEEEDR